MNFGSLIPPPQPMDTKGNVAANWKYFKSSWQNYFVALELKKKDPAVQIATLKAVMGKECFQIYEHLPLSDEEHKDLDTILSALTEHFEPKTNVIYERYIFNSCKQENTENIESYLARLRKLAATCEYGALLDEMLRDRIVIGISDNQIRARLLRESKLTLQKALEICRSSEQANLHLQQMDPAESAHYIKGKGKPQSSKQSKQKSEDIIRSCLFCGKSHTRGRCPAYGTTCSICNKKNHLPERCRAKSAGASTRPKYEHQNKTRHTFATSRFEQYILGKEEVMILTDHKPLVSIFSKSILTSPKRLQRMRLRLQKYPLQVHYKPGPQMFLSDTLSRASLPNDQTAAEMPEYLIYSLQKEEDLMLEIADTNNDDAIFVTDQRLEKVRQETARDITLQTLMSIIHAGWPNDKNKTPLAVRTYWPYRDELVASNGLVFRGTRLIIPTNMRAEMVKRAHASHMGIHYTLNTARDIMYWPGMPSELTEVVQHCSTCQEAQNAQVKEPMMTYPLPKQPWQIVASDCFELAGKHYCVFVDVYSGYIELCNLEDLTAETLIDRTKQVFATHGIPVTLISDNGPNYAAKEFANFACAWDFQHVTSSPHHSKSNGRAEAAVKTVKNIMKKSQDGEIWKSILEWRNTITPGTNSSPVQRLMSRRTRSFLPCHPEQYSPKVQEGLTEQVILNRASSKEVL